MLGTDRRVTVLALARASDAFGNSFLVVALPLFLAERAIGAGVLGLSQPAAIGVALACLGFVNSALQPFVGRLSDSLGRRRVFVLGGLGLLALANLAFLVATDYGTVLALRVAQGVALAAAIPCTIALVSDFSDVASRGASMGVYNTVRLIGYGAGPIAAGALIHGGPYPLGGSPTGTLSGIQAAFLVAALAALAGALAVAVAVRDPEHLEARAETDVGVRVRGSGPRTVDPVFALALATLFVAISISLIASLQPEVNARLGQSPAWFGVQFSMFLVPHVLLQTPIGHASDAWGRRPFVVGGLVLCVPATLLQGFVLTPWHLLAARLFQGFATALFFAPGLAMAGDLAQARGTGSTLSLLTMAFGLGVAAGPLLGGLLVGFGFAVPFAVGAALVALVALLAATQLDETARTEEPPAPGASDPVSGNRSA